MPEDRGAEARTKSTLNRCHLVQLRLHQSLAAGSSMAILNSTALHRLPRKGRSVSGLGLPIIGKLLGHTQASTTQRYAHLDADPLRRASEAIGGRLPVCANPVDHERLCDDRSVAAKAMAFFGSAVNSWRRLLRVSDATTPVFQPVPASFAAQ
jgi:hypothetical protein